MAQILLEDIRKKYVTSGNVTNALNGVNLKIEQGEMVAVMGPSGSGKTTMLNILGCLDNPSDGRYFLKDINVEDNNADILSKIRNQNIGFIFQQFALIDDYTIMENVELPLLYRNMHNKEGRLSKKEIKIKVLEVLASLGIKEHYYKYPSQLSGGQQQRAAIARAIICEPDIIIADEPTGALDQKNGIEVMNLLIDINKKGKTVIVVTHDEKIAAFCKRRIDILDGKIINDEIQIETQQELHQNL